MPNPLVVNNDEKGRADLAAEATKQVFTEGVSGAEVLPRLVEPEQWQAQMDISVRQATYGTLRALQALPAMAEPAFANNWAHLGGVYDTQILCWVDALGLKHLQGSCYRTSGTAVNGEVMFELPEWMRPERDGLIWLVGTDAGVGRCDLIGTQVLFRTTGGYSTGQGYRTFDNVAPYR
ncbi:MAG: hypothetical protein WAZ94_15265 [Phycisphaerales bacterium]|nr:hypothetical protein [Chloroflexota bacterium]